MSGPLWLEIPGTWIEGKVKHLAHVTLGKMLQGSDSGDDTLAPYLRAANIQPDGVLDLSDVNEMWFRPSELAGLDLRSGDVVVVEGGQGGFGRAAFVAADLTGMGFQNSVNRLRPAGHVDGRYLAFYLIALRASGYIRAYCNVVSMPHLTAEKLAAVPMPIPPLDVQRAIADYLDHETAQIDELIAEQQRLIELFHERRQAQIDREIEGVGAPKTQLRRAIQFLTSGSRGWGDYYADAGERFVRIGNLPRRSLELAGEVQYVDLPPGETEGERTRLQLGDVLFSITAYLGSVAVTGADWENAYVSQHVALCRLDQSVVDPRFVGFAMLSSGGQNQLNEVAVGGTKLQLALDDIRGLRVPFASLDEQRQITEYLDDHISRIDTLIAEAERLIELARERRSAVITAAVTGQLDLRKVA